MSSPIRTPERNPDRRNEAISLSSSPIASRLRNRNRNRNIFTANTNSTNIYNFSYPRITEGANSDDSDRSFSSTSTPTPSTPIRDIIRDISIQQARQLMANAARNGRPRHTVQLSPLRSMTPLVPESDIMHMMLSPDSLGETVYNILSRSAASLPVVTTKYAYNGENLVIEIINVSSTNEHQLRECKISRLRINPTLMNNRVITMLLYYKRRNPLITVNYYYNSPDFILVVFSCEFSSVPLTNPSPQINNLIDNDELSNSLEGNNIIDDNIIDDIIIDDNIGGREIGMFGGGIPFDIDGGGDNTSSSSDANEMDEITHVSDGSTAILEILSSPWRRT